MTTATKRARFLADCRAAGQTILDELDKSPAFTRTEWAVNVTVGLVLAVILYTTFPHP